MVEIKSVHPYREGGEIYNQLLEAVRNLEAEGKKCILLPDQFEAGNTNGTRIEELDQYIKEQKKKGEPIDVRNIVLYSNTLGILFVEENPEWNQAVNNKRLFKNESRNGLFGVWRNKQFDEQRGGIHVLYVDTNRRIARVIVLDGKTDLG